MKETPWVQKYLDDGWQWLRKAPMGTPHLVRDGRTLCGRSAEGMRPDTEFWHGCFSCRDIAGGIIFNRNQGIAL